MVTALLCFVLFQGVSFVCLGGFYLAGTLLGATPTLVNLGTGPRLFRFSVRKVQVQLALIPVGGYVKFAGADWDDPSDAITPDARGERPVRFVDLHPLARAGIAFAGPLALMLVASALLGPRPALESAGRAVPQLARVARSPIDVGAPMFVGVAALPADRGVAATVGTFAAKLAAWNLLPVFGCPGFAMLSALLCWRRRPGRTHQVMSMVTLIVGFVGMALLLVALGAAIVG